MNFMTIGEVAKKFKISPRMLRYYDSIGLLPCLREEGNDYRLYDENAVSYTHLLLERKPHPPSAGARGRLLAAVPYPYFSKSPAP